MSMQLQVESSEEEKHFPEVEAGFTGTKDGMTPQQQEGVYNLLSEFAGTFHHGDCKGADAEAHGIAQSLGYTIVVHPPLIGDLRAGCWGDISRKEKGYLERNRDIVDETEFLIATPKTDEVLRSGTWATIRYARKQGKKIYIIYGDGGMRVENPQAQKFF